MLILILGVVLWNSKPNSTFLGKFKSKKSNSLLCLEAGTQSILKMSLKRLRGRFGGKDENE